MTGLLLGAALIVSATGVSPVPETSCAAVVPAAYNFDVPYDLTTSSEPLGRRKATQQPLHPTPKRFSTTDRVIGVAAGTALGFLVGGIIGGHITATDNPDDDTSPLKGIVIGAPIGGALGGLFGFWLTNR